MLQRQPQPGSWSMGQVYVHIIGDTAWFADQMEACLLNNINSEQEMHEHAKAIFRNNRFPDGPLENPANAGMPQPQSREALLQGLTAIHEKVNRLYARFDFSAATGKTEHPGFRFFNAAEWLQFAEMHMRHHQRQKQRIDDALFAR
ncbi:DinB family protein [Chitinophaga japonensis]|uniref:DinB family protein n=2 Tax=Chitinophaga japonensis TaxID=104662 RepID=A0A562T5Y3_CHIJA|nr:DinB family protein [Chitinophaga japonensis]